jgi:protein-L-isoaspartate(D-aspartate) O-methyltransferase
VLPRDRHRAYLDRALPIEREQTISQPWVVARMTELLEVDGDSRVLEVGTGSGYQAAVLAAIVKAVFSIEIEEELAASSRQRLERLGYSNVQVRAGDGFYGWPEEAPCDAAIITAAAPRVPPLIVKQLKEGGRLVMPLDDGTRQSLVRCRKRGGEVTVEPVTEVIFVPMVGAVRKEP